MKPTDILLRALAIGGLFVTGPALANDNAHPTVIELYQSQGCSDCPPAVANINKLADRSDVIALTFAVTYWDNLGWKDTFATPAYTARQWDYAHTGGRGSVATPQVVINGRGTANGGNLPALIGAIRQNDRGAGGPAISANGGKVTIGAASGGKPATVWLVRYDPRSIDVPIRAGENGGKTIAHRNVVRSLQQLGSWNGSAMTVAVPSGNAAYKTAILVQQGKGGPIVAAAKI